MVCAVLADFSEAKKNSCDIGTHTHSYMWEKLVMRSSCRSRWRKEYEEMRVKRLRKTQKSQKNLDHSGEIVGKG